MILVTGSAGFIGYHTSRKLCEKGETVIGIDNLNTYYDVNLKKSRLAILEKFDNFTFFKADICDLDKIDGIFRDNPIKRVCHLAAQAGVRYSLENPLAYQKSNNEGFINIIESVKKYPVENFVFASTSSIYGTNTKLPFSETDPTHSQASLYAATKKFNEAAAHAYSHLFSIPCSGLRFFTVYGPWGRPDMALFKFSEAILKGKSIDVYNYGKMKRNFTYVDDIVNGILLVLNNPQPFEVYNIGNDKAEDLMDFVREIEKQTGKKAEIKYLPMQAGDIPATEADISKISRLGYSPSTDIDKGIEYFLKWYREYYNCG